MYVTLHVCLSKSKPRRSITHEMAFPKFPSCAVAWMLAVTMLLGLGESKCLFDAIFNFGDSNSDTGGLWAAFPPTPRPNGMTYFQRPSGRASDGRLVIDFIAGEQAGFPFLRPYLQSIGGYIFTYGANFATIGSTVLTPNTSYFVSGISPFPLGVQLNQFKEFKAEVDKVYRDPNLPSPDVFGKALYTIYIGQNDFTGNLGTIGIRGVKKYLPQVVSQIMDTIKEIYGLGGRMFLVQNLAPIGCFPMFLVELPHKSSDIDAFGCMISYNKAVADYNNMLKKAITKTRKQLPGSDITYVDTYSVLLDLYQHPTSHGFKYGTKACCGHGGGKYNFNPQAFCGTSKLVGGKNVTATACADPQNYVSWDGIHTTEAANRFVAYRILEGAHSDPPVEIHCAHPEV